MSDAQVVQDLALAGKIVQATPEVKNGDTRGITYVHKDMREIDVNRFMEHPEYIKSNVMVSTIDSFIAYADRFKVDPVVFGHQRSAGELFECVLDYHTPEQPSFCRHNVSLNVSHSLQWIRWTDNEGERLSQRKFSEFIEDNAGDLVSDIAPLLSQIQSVRVSGGHTTATTIHNEGKEVSAEGHLRLASGLPEPMTLALMPWRGMGSYMEIKARVRAHIKEGEPVRFSYELLNADIAVESKFNDYVVMIAKSLKVQVLI